MNTSSKAPRRARTLLIGIAATAALMGGASTVEAQYPPAEPTGSIILSTTANCTTDVPYIDYKITPVGFESTGLATIAITDTQGASVETLTVSMLQGRIIWPGAVADSNGNPTDLPGSKAQGGVWVADPSDAILLKGLVLTATVDASATQSVTYPCEMPSTASAAATQVLAQSAGSLPSTGSSGISTVTMIAGLILLAGISVSIWAGLSKRRHGADELLAISAD